MEEGFFRQGLREEIRHVVDSGDKRNTQATFLYALANEVVAPIDVLCTRMMFRVVRDVDGRLVVHPWPDTPESRVQSPIHPES